jgi:hypothetical protein
MLMRSVLLLACLLGLVVPAAAQTPLVVRVITTCGTVPTTYIAGSNNPAVQDVNGNFCTSASVSASITGFPGASPTTGTPISVTASAGGVTGTLPAGAVVVASNVGTTNIAYCKLGATSTTSDQPIAPNGGWFAFTVGAATQLTCITSTSTTTVNMVGGAGLPTGTGGGGGGSGGAVTLASGAVSSGAYSSGSIASGAYASGAFASGAFASGSVASGAFASGSLATGSMVDLLTMRGTKNAGTAATNSMQVGGVYNSTPLTLTDTQQASLQFDANGNLRTATPDGANIALGAVADAAATSGSTGTLSAKLRLMTSQLNTISSNTSSSIPAGTNTIGTAGQLPYPVGSTPYTATATGTTGATTATLAGASSVTTYLCGFSIRSNATAAATGNATVTGVITATLNFTHWTAPLASGIGLTEMIFNPCVPASGTNQSVAVVSPAPGSGGTVSVAAWGYKL